MSLILRRECQDQLDQAGLGSYHVEINGNRGDNKNLCIVGECGQPFITLYGVSFAKLAPTRGEIAYAVELLREFLASHKKKIDEYLVEKIAFLGRKEPEVSRPDMKLYTAYSGTRWNVKFSDDMYKYLVHIDGSIVEADIKTPNTERSSPKGYTVEELEKHEFPTKKYKEALAWLVELKDYDEARRKVEDMETALSSCHV